MVGEFVRGKNIRIYYECEARIEKSVPMITVRHHKACQMMTNSDCEGRIFLSHPHKNNDPLFGDKSFYLIFNKHALLCRLMIFLSDKKIMFQGINVSNASETLCYDAPSK